MIGFSGNPYREIMKGILGSNKVKAHWSGSMAGKCTFDPIVTTTCVTLPGDERVDPSVPRFHGM